MNNPDIVLDRLAARATQLYSLPAVAMKVLELTGNPHVDTQSLKRCIENDPALTGKILRVVNSSLFGLSREVSDLNQALALLGIKPLKMLVLGFSLPPALFTQIERDVLQRYWRHTLTKAVAGREISESLWKLPGDDAFVAGLLQDLGELLLIQEIGEPYCRLLRKVEQGHFDLAALEAETIGFDHTALTARVLAGWRLPDVLAESVSWGEGLRPSDGVAGVRSPMQQILHLAELLARFLADGRPEALAELLVIGRNYREFSDEQLERLVETLEEKVLHLADVLSLDLPEGLNYSDVLVRAHRELASVAESVAGGLLGGGAGSEPPAEVTVHGAAQAVSSAPWEGDSPIFAAATVDHWAKTPLVPRKLGQSTCERLPAEEQSLLNELEDLTAAVAGYRVSPAAAPTPATVAAAASTTASGTAGGVATCARSIAAPNGADRGAADCGVEPERALIGHLTVAARACRDSRCPLSLVLLQLEPPADEGFAPGTTGFEVLLEALERGCRELDHYCATCLPTGPGGLALILPDCERRQAVEYGNQLIRQLRCWVRDAGWTGRASEVIVSVGAATIAMPPRNFSPADMVDAASRCAYASRSSAGVVKSIEIY